MREVKKSFASLHLEQKIIEPSILDTEREIERTLRTKRRDTTSFNLHKVEQVLRYGDPVQLNVSFKYSEQTQNLKMSEAQQLGAIISGSFIDGSVTISDNNAQNSENLFTIMPAVELNSKIRVDRQIQRIRRYKAGKFSANRIDDSEEIKKNIDNLDRQLQIQINIARAQIGNPVKFGSQVNLIHLPSKRFLGARARASGCQMEFEQYIPHELCLRYPITNENAFQITPFYAYQKKGNQIREGEPFAILFTDNSVRYSPLMTDKLQKGGGIPMSHKLVSYFHFQNPYPRLNPQANIFTAHIFKHMCGASFLIKHRERDLFLTAVHLGQRTRVSAKAQRVQLKIIRYRLQIGSIGLKDKIQEEQSSMPTSPRGMTTCREFYRKQASISDHLKAHSKLRRSQQLMQSNNQAFSKSDYDLFFVTKKINHMNTAQLLWSIVPSKDSPDEIMLYNILNHIYIGPLIISFRGQQKDLQNDMNLFCAIKTQTGEIFTLEACMTADNFSRVRLINENSAFHTANSEIIFNFLPINASLDLKVRFIASCLTDLRQLNKGLNTDPKKIIKLRDILQCLIKFLSNAIPELLSQNQESGRVSYANQMMIQNSGIVGQIFKVFQEIFKTELKEKRKHELRVSEIRLGLAYQSNCRSQNEEVSELEICFDFLYNFINQYIYENSETSKEIFIYFMKKYIIEKHHFKHATLHALVFLKRMITNVEIYFDYIENTFKNLGFFLLRSLRGSHFSIGLKVEILEILSQMAQILINQQRISIAQKLFSFLVTDQSSGETYLYMSDEEEAKEEEFGSTDQLLLMNRLHKYITLGEQHLPVQNICESLNALDDNFVLAQIQLYSKVQRLFCRQFENKHVKKAIKLLVTYYRGERPKQQVAAALLRLINSLLQKNEMLLFEMPCTVRFNNEGEKERSYDTQVNREKRLSPKNIKYLMAIDSFLINKADITADEAQLNYNESFIAQINEMNLVHIELINLYNNFSNICIIQHEDRVWNWMQTLLLRYMDFWENKTQKQASISQMRFTFPKILELDLRIIESECNFKFRAANETCAINAVPYIKRAFTQSFQYVEAIKKARSFQQTLRLEDPFRERSDKIPRDKIISGICLFIQQICVFDIDSFLNFYNMLVQYTHDEQSEKVKNVLNILGPRPQLPPCNQHFIILNSNYQGGLVEILARWIEKARNQGTKNDILETIHKVSALKEECVRNLKNSLFLESRASNFQHFIEIMQYLPQIQQITTSEFNYWSSLTTDSSSALPTVKRISSTDAVRGRKFSVMTSLNELLQKVEEIFNHYYGNSMFSNSRDNSDVLDIKLSLNPASHQKNGSETPLIHGSQEAIEMRTFKRTQLLSMEQIQNFFREIGGLPIIMKLMNIHHGILTEAVNECYQAFRNESKEMPQICNLTFQVFTRLFTILKLFVLNNTTNITEMSNHIESTLPYYGEMYMMSSIIPHSQQVEQLEAGIFQFHCTMFGTPTPLVHDFDKMDSYIKKLDLKLVHSKLKYTLEIYSEILSHTIDPHIIGLIIDNLISLRSQFMGKNEVNWDQVYHYIGKIKKNLEKQGFSIGAKKISDFQHFLKTQIQSPNLGVELKLQNQFQPDTPRPLELSNVSPQQEKVQRDRRSHYLRHVTSFNFMLDNKKNLSTDEGEFKKDSGQYLVKMLDQEKKECFEHALIFKLNQIPRVRKRKCCSKDRPLEGGVLPYMLEQHVSANKLTLLSQILTFMTSIDLSNQNQILAYQFFTDQVYQIVQLFDSKALLYKLIETVCDMLMKHDFEKRAMLIPGILRLGNKILEDNSLGAPLASIQKKFFNFFTVTQQTNPMSSIARLLKMTENYIEVKKILPSYLFKFKELPACFHALHFMKSLCENHNEDFQPYLGHQPHVLYPPIDLVATTVDLLSVSLQTLSDYYKLGSFKQMSFSEELASFSRSYSRMSVGKSSTSYLEFKDMDFHKANIKELMNNVEECLITLIEFVQGPCIPNQVKIIQAGIFRGTKNLFQEMRFTFKKEPSVFNHYNAQLLKLKGLGALLITSILEGRNGNDPIVKAVSSEIFLRDVGFLVAYTYYAFSELMGGQFQLDSQYFESNEENFGLQNAYSIFFMLLKMSESKNQEDDTQDDLMILERLHSTADSHFKASSNIFTRIGVFCKSLFSCRSQRRSNTKGQSLERLRKDKFLRNFDGYIEDGIHFFKTNTCQIEVYHESSGNTIAYFPKAPSYRNITSKQKEDFLFSLSTSEDRVEPDSIAMKGRQLMEEIGSEYSFKSSFTKCPVIGAIVLYSDIWRDIAFYISLVINLLFLLSYTREGGNLFQDPILLYSDDLPADDAITALGALFVFFAVLAYLFSAIYRVPFHIMRYRQRQERSNEENPGGCYKFWSITIAVSCDNFLLYAIAYILFGFLGVFYHRFFFGFHLLAIVTRSADMRNILKAIQKSGKESLLILLLFFIAQFIFALAAFSSYSSDVPKNLCVSMMTCFLTYIDNTFKNNGGVGVFMDQTIPSTFMLHNTVDIGIGRIVFDFLFNLVILIILIQLYAAVLIDTFSAMRAEKNNLEKLMRNTCLVCGQSRNQIETEGQNFNVHIKKYHNIFNYIRFIAFLAKKDKNDYTGLESYVAQKNKELDFTWIPSYLKSNPK